MADQGEKPAGAANPIGSLPAKQYMLVAVIGLGLMLLALLETGLGAWAAVPFVLGLGAILFRWSAGPPAILLLLAILCVMTRAPNRRRLFALLVMQPAPLDFNFPTSLTSELLLGAGFLLYAAGQYRLLSIVQGIVPPDRRRPGVYDEEIPPTPRRAVETVDSREAITSAMVMPLFALGAYVLWEIVDRQRNPPEGMSGDVYRILLLIWIAASVLFSTTAIIGYMGLNRQDKLAARIYLQDQVWRQTRREQARINHWLHWARLKRQARDAKKRDKKEEI